MRIFLDANILFSAAWHDGSIREFMVMLVNGGHVLVVNPYVIDEAERNLRIHKANALADLDRILRSVQIAPTFSHADDVVDNLGLPAGDRHVLSSAIHCECDVSITGDRKHFGHLFKKKLGRVLIVSPAQAYDLLLK